MNLYKFTIRLNSINDETRASEIIQNALYMQGKLYTRGDYYYIEYDSINYDLYAQFQRVSSLLIESGITDSITIMMNFEKELVSGYYKGDKQ